MSLGREGSSRVTLREIMGPGWPASRRDRHAETLQPLRKRPESTLLEGRRGWEGRPSAELAAEKEWAGGRGHSEVELAAHHLKTHPGT